MVNEFLEVKQGLIHVADENGKPQPIYPMTTSDMVIDPITGNTLQGIMKEVDIDGFSKLSKEFSGFQTALKEEIGEIGVLDKVATLTNPTTELLVERDSFARIAEIKGRTIVNPVPTFNSGLWGGLYNNASLTLTNVTPKSITVRNVGEKNEEYVSSIIRLEPNTDYTLSTKGNGSVAVFPKNDNLNPIQGYIANGFATFNTGVNEEVNIFLVIPKGKDLNYDEISINKGVKVLPYVKGVQGIKNPTITNYHGNLVPDFSHNNFVREEASYSDVNKWFNVDRGVIIDRRTYEHKNVTDIPRINIPVTAGKTYTLSAITESKVDISTNNGNMKDESQIETLHYDLLPLGKVTFTVPVGVKFVRIMFGDKVTNPTPFKVSDVALVEGAEKFSGEFKTSTLTAKTTLYEGEVLRLNESGSLEKLKLVEDINLTGDLDWNLHSTHVGYKAVKFPLNKNHKGNILAIKFNGSILKRVSAVSQSADAVASDIKDAPNNVWITIPNTDSGWGDNYNPTPDEIKTYFLGWRMFDNSVIAVDGVPVMYNGTGVKAWHSWGDDGNYGNIQNHLPTTQTPINSKWKPYRLIYELETPYVEEVQTVGSLTLSKGNNNLVVTEGKVIREVANPIYYPQANIWIVNAGDNAFKASWLKHFTKQILQVYKNGVPYHNVSLGMSTGGLKPMEFVINNYDANAVYEVDYIPQRLCEHTAPVNGVTIKYASSLSTLVEQLVEVGANLEVRTSDIENMISLGAIESGFNANGEYHKFSNGLLICKTVLQNNNAKVAYGAIFKTDHDIWIFPHEFADKIPYVDVSEYFGLGNTWCGLGDIATTLTGTSYVIFSPVPSEVKSYVTLVAIGRWKK